MNEIISFFNNIFCEDDRSAMKIGLSQFKDNKTTEKSTKPQKTVKSEVKLSDLMRGV